MVRVSSAARAVLGRGHAEEHAEVAAEVRLVGVSGFAREGRVTPRARLGEPRHGPPKSHDPTERARRHADRRHETTPERAHTEPARGSHGGHRGRGRQREPREATRDTHVDEGLPGSRDTRFEPRLERGEARRGLVPREDTIPKARHLRGANEILERDVLLGQGARRHPEEGACHPEPQHHADRRRRRAHVFVVRGLARPSHDRRPERRTSRREPQGRAVPHDEMKLARGDHPLPPRTARR